MFLIPLSIALAANPKLDLVGVWTAKVQFTTGAFASVKDLEFLLAFHEDGTMTESSNYDASPPVPPAYGIWRRTGVGRFEAKYVFYNTKAPTKFQDISDGGGWAPNGKGTLKEQITLARDGSFYTSSMTLEMVDAKGKRTDFWKAKVRATRMKF